MGMPQTGITCPFAVLSGAVGDADEDGFGVAFLSIDSSTRDVCYEVAVANIMLPASAMHICVGAAGVNGSVAVPFLTSPDADGLTMGCTKASAETIVATPEGFYFNVHTRDFRNGAVRGQLMNWKMMMDMDMTGMDTAQMMQMVEMMSMGHMESDMMEMTPEAAPES
jgi:hypothetical protein